MAKAKNRASRKKAQEKKVNQVKAGKPDYFDGYLKIPLDNMLEADEVRNRSEFYGEWDRKRAEILSEPRLFKVTAHIFNSKGDKAVATIDYQSAGTNYSIAEAATIAFDAARNGTADMNMRESYIVIRAQKNNGEHSVKNKPVKTPSMRIL